MNDLCNEIFIDDIVRVQVYRAEDISMPLPSTIPHVSNMQGTVKKAPMLDISYVGDGMVARDGTILAKSSQKMSGSTPVYIFNIEMNIEHGIKEVCDTVQTLMGNDFHVIVTKADSSQHLLYALPSTSYVDTTGGVNDCNVKLSLTSNNNLIAFSRQG